MVKRSKLTLNHTAAEEHVVEATEADIPESVLTDQPVDSDTKNNLGKILILAGLTIASLILFRQKFF